MPLHFSCFYVQLPQRTRNYRVAQRAEQLSSRHFLRLAKGAEQLSVALVVGEGLEELGGLVLERGAEGEGVRAELVRAADF